MLAFREEELAGVGSCPCRGWRDGLEGDLVEMRRGGVGPLEDYKLQRMVMGGRSIRT